MNKFEHLQSQFCDLVFDPRRNLGEHDPRHKTVALQLPQYLRQRLLTYTLHTLHQS